ncbi:MAG: hypothetical protein HC923_07315 [Myxococcales bacterium]|nr:hypothetical protein [Myxococcales bacterium]
MDRELQDDGLLLFAQCAESLGAIDVSTLFPATGLWEPWYSPYVRRSVMADDYAYAITDVGIVVAPIANPTATVGTLSFR